MRLTILTICMLLSSLYCVSQSTNINGKLIDSVGKQSLENASISLLDSKDSTLEQFALSKSNGFFELKNIPIGLYLLQISFQGFEVISKKIQVNKDQPMIQLGNLYLKQQTKDLGNVTVTIAPISIKKDTIEYNAGSFKTKPNALAEDLLKKMPGIQVDKDGNVKASGEDVQRVLVDGKRFFGDDPKMATKNLPSDIIDKIQVFDAQSDQSAFTGFDDGNKTKTINIVTKKDKRKGLFGKGSVGLGSDGNQTLTDNNLSLSNFNNGKQITLTAQGNNVNKQNFNVQDILGSLGSRMGGGFGGTGKSSGGLMNMVQNLIGSGNGNGLVNTWSAGLNYSNSFGKDELNTSGFYNSQKTNKNNTSFTEYVNPKFSDSSIFKNENSNSFTQNNNGRFNLNYEKQLDSSGTNSFILRPSVSFQNTAKSSTTISNSSKAKIINLNNSNAATNSENIGYNANIDFTFRHRFKTKGRSLSVGLNAGRNDNDGDGNNFSTTNYYDTITHSNIAKSLQINQQYNSFSTTKNYGSTLSYTEPIGKYAQLEFAYNHSYQQAESDKATYGYDSIKAGYATVIGNLTNSFRNTYKSDRGTISYRLSKTKFNVTVGNGFQWGNLNSINRTTGNKIIQDYINLFPTANFNYSFTKTQNLRFNYSGRTNQPSVTQLQPVLNNSDPLNISNGNPNLQQKFTHNFRLFYNSFNIFTQKIFIVAVNGNFVANDIQNSIINLENGGRITMPVNLDGTYNLTAYINYGFPLRKPKSNLNFGLNFNRMQSQSLLDNESNYSRNTTIGTNLIWTTNLKEKWDINFTSNTTFNLARYSLQPSLDADYFSQYLSTEITYYTKSGWNFASDFDYTYNSGRSSGYNSSIPLLNASISKQIFKNKSGEIKLYAFDLLKQNQSITRDITSSYIQDVQTTVLSNYFLVSFSYNLRKFKGQGAGMPNMGRMFKGNRGGF